jgi:ribosomal protein S18 acetylase RimI-like enzyme
MSDTITLLHLGPDHLKLLETIPEGLFDNPVRPDQAKAFLASPSHDIVVAMAGDLVVGMASGLAMLHPDKAPAYFISEVGVRDAYQRRGIATRLCRALHDISEKRGCAGIWVATEGDNHRARALYRALAARETAQVVVYDWDDPAMDEAAAASSAG